MELDGDRKFYRGLVLVWHTDREVPNDVPVLDSGSPEGHSFGPTWQTGSDRVI
jgi:hypothetical protein